MSNNELTYIVTITRAELEGEIDSIWRALRIPGRLRDESIAAGFQIDELPDRDQAIIVAPDSAGFSPVETAIIISFAPVVAKIARDVWDQIILPRIRQRYGQDALSEK